MQDPEAEYLACDGGPHIVVPVAFAGLWGGTPLHADDVLDPTADYGRVCALAGPIDALRVGPGTALVLGQNPPMTAWARSLEPDVVDLFVLQSWRTEDLDALLAESSEMPSDAWRDLGMRWEIPAPGGAYLMSAGDTVESAVYGRHLIPLEPGTYRVTEALFESADGCVRVFRIRRSI